MIDRELVTRKLVLIAQELPAIEELAAQTFLDRASAGARS